MAITRYSAKSRGCACCSKADAAGAKVAGGVTTTVWDIPGATTHNLADPYAAVFTNFETRHTEISRNGGSLEVKFNDKDEWYKIGYNDSKILKGENVPGNIHMMQYQSHFVV